MNALIGIGLAYLGIKALSKGSPAPTRGVALGSAGPARFTLDVAPATIYAKDNAKATVEVEGPTLSSQEKKTGVPGVSYVSGEESRRVALATGATLMPSEAEQEKQLAAAKSAASGSSFDTDPYMAHNGVAPSRETQDKVLAMYNADHSATIFGYFQGPGMGLQPMRAGAWLSQMGIPHWQPPPPLKIGTGTWTEYYAWAEQNPGG